MNWQLNFSKCTIIVVDAAAAAIAVSVINQSINFNSGT